MIHRISLTAWRVAVTVLHSLAIASALLRLSQRYRARRLWLDDYAAFVCLILNCIYMVSLWLRAPIGDPKQSRETRIILNWLSAISFPCVVWSARISIMLSIVRILPPLSMMRRAAIFLAVSFGMMGTILVGEIIRFCTRSSWYFGPFQCQLGPLVGITGLCTDITADTLLVAIPFRLLRRAKLPKNHRRLITLIFSASILTSLASIVYTVFLFAPPSWGLVVGSLVLFTAHLEAAISLLVCNLLVVVTFFYRIFRNDEDLEVFSSEEGSSYRDSNATRPRARPRTRARAVPLTTISFTDVSLVGTFDTTPARPHLEANYRSADRVTEPSTT